MESEELELPGSGGELIKPVDAVVDIAEGDSGEGARPTHAQFLPVYLQPVYQFF